MCFSATASFLTAAALLPIGLETLRLARQRSPRLLPLAATPLLFAAQQAVEGWLWLGQRGMAPVAVVMPAAITYLGFAFALWPVWLPLLLDPARIAPMVQQGSINYQVPEHGSALVGHGLVTLFYLLLIWVIRAPRRPHPWVAISPGP